MNILLFGITKSIIGNSSLSIPASVREKHGIGTVDGLKKYLHGQYPDLGKLSSLAVAVNNTYAAGDLQLSDHDEIALIPPVSGG